MTSEGQLKALVVLYELKRSVAY